MNANLSVEEVLQRHTVHELRDLIAQLERECGGKQTELQQMVGSTYHDFIQSADTIAVMQDKSQLMNKQLGMFGHLAESIAEQTQSMLASAALATATATATAVQQQQQQQQQQPLSHTHGGSPRARSNSGIGNVITRQQHVKPVMSRSSSSLMPRVAPLGWSWRDISSCKVWGFLDQCDIYSACQMIVTAEALLCLDSSDATEISSSDLGGFLVNRVKQLLAQSVSSISTANDEPLLQRCSGVEYLHQTVVDDCALLFLYGQCDPAESARSMAGLAGLSLCSSLGHRHGKLKDAAIVSGGELLRMYLEGTDLRLLEVCQALAVGGRQEGDLDDEIDLEQLTSLLVSAVNKLQQTILNVYLIFFKKTKCTADSGNDSDDGLFCSTLVEFLVQSVGVDDVKDRENIWAVVRGQVKKTFPQAAVLTAWRSWILEQTTALQKACVTALTHVTTAHDVAKAQRVTLHQCLHFSSPYTDNKEERATGQTDASALSIRVPGTSDSSAGVDHDEVWNAACSLLLLPFTLSGSSGMKKSASSSGGSSNGGMSGGATLWSHVFRKPFITQVEKMLKVSCRDIFHRFKNRFLRTLVNFGGSGQAVHSKSDHPQDLTSTRSSTRNASRLIINPVSLEVSLRESTYSSDETLIDIVEDEWSWVDNYTGHKNRGEGLGRKTPQNQTSRNTSTSLASSVEIFFAAEGIRRQFESDITEYLLTDVFEQSNITDEQDLEALTTLSRSLQVQCCELVGQVMVFLRVMATNLSATIKQQKMDARVMKRKSTAKHSNSEGNIHTDMEGETSLQSGLLLISRISWLLQGSQGTFLEYALLIQQAACERDGVGPMKSPTRQHHQQHMTSLEQLQSAFDIADTDGDGVITFAEALEAVNALWISDDITSSSESGGGPSSVEFLWFDTSSLAGGGESSSPPHHPFLTYTMPEFRLVCSQMIPPPMMNTSEGHVERNQGIIEGDEWLDSPVACVHSLLASLGTSSLKAFVDTALGGHLSTSLTEAFQKDFPFASAVPRSGNNGVAVKDTTSRPSLLGSFRFSWQSLSLVEEVGRKSEEDEEEDDVLDTPVQPSRATFRFLVGLSQISHAAFLSIDTTQCLSLTADGNVACLATKSEDALFTSGLELFLLSSTSARNELVESVAKSSMENIQELFEDYCAQMVFDLSLLENTLISSITVPGGLMDELDRCREEWVQLIDPINWSLLGPLVKSRVLKYLEKNRMFIPGGNKPSGDISMLTSDGVLNLDENLNKKKVEKSSFLRLFPASINNSSSKKGKSNGTTREGSDTSKFSLLPLPLTSSLAPYSEKGVGRGSLQAPGDRSLLVLKGGKLSEFLKKGGGGHEGKGVSTSSSKLRNGVKGSKSVDQGNDLSSNGGSANGLGDNKKGKGWFF